MRQLEENTEAILHLHFITSSIGDHPQEILMPPLTFVGWHRIGFATAS
jgi:hypothetical protein